MIDLIGLLILLAAITYAVHAILTNKEEFSPPSDDDWP